MRGRRFLIRYFAWVLALAGAWLLASRWLVPALVESAYHERSLATFNRILSGRDVHTLDSYQRSWEAIAGRIDVALGGVAVVLFLLLLLRVPTRVRAVLQRLSERSDLASVPFSAGGTLLAAASAGLIVGTLTGAFLAYMSFGRGQAVPDFRLVSGDVVWMAPLADLALFLVLGLLLVLLGLGWRRLRSRRWVCFVVLFASLFPLLMLPGWLHGWSAALLALGLAYQGSLCVAILWRTRVAGSAALGLGALAVTMAAGLQVQRVVSERSAYADLPEPQPNAPNVLIVVLDAVRARSMSAYGYERSTSPEFDRLTEEAVVFDRAIATAPWSLPSHAAILTGRYNFELGTDFITPLDGTYRMLSEELRDKGYYTIASVGNLIFATPLFGLDRGFVRYRAQPRSFGVILRSSWIGRNLIPWMMRRLGNHRDLARKRAAQVNRDILDWVEAAPERPFFAFLNYFDAHGPFVAPPPFDRRFISPPYRYWWWQEGEAAPPPEDLEEIQAAYDACIAHVDYELGLLLSELERLGRLDDTLVIITSDHGEAFLEHGHLKHGSSLHLEQIRVPLLIRYPRLVPAGVRIADPVSIRSIPSTVMDLLGLAEEKGSPFPGPSLARFWQDADGRPAGERAVLAELGRRRSLIADSWHYIVRASGDEELYDLRADPLERNDLSDDAQAREDLLALRAHLAELLDADDLVSPPAAGPDR